ncbi:hypothetical protein [Streptomyces sp. NPDC058985]|uniref:hypothetical protein n=1 Tax=Streptomyces sp. NPDC058985 TaxID=3346684 RepID=UPI003686D381
MDLDRTPPEIARSAAEEIRALNHVTINAKAYETAPAVSEVVSALVNLIERMPQALQQAGAGLEALHDRDQIRLAGADSTSRALAEAVANVTVSLDYARNDLESVLRELKAAAGPLDNMGGPWPDSDEGGRV